MKNRISAILLMLAPALFFSKQAHAVIPCEAQIDEALKFSGRPPLSEVNYVVSQSFGEKFVSLSAFDAKRTFAEFDAKKLSATAELREMTIGLVARLPQWWQRSLNQLMVSNRLENSRSYIGHPDLDRDVQVAIKSADPFTLLEFERAISNEMQNTCGSSRSRDSIEREKNQIDASILACKAAPCSPATIRELNSNLAQIPTLIKSLEKENQQCLQDNATIADYLNAVKGSVAVLRYGLNAKVVPILAMEKSNRLIKHQSCVKGFRATATYGEVVRLHEIRKGLESKCGYAPDRSPGCALAIDEIHKQISAINDEAVCGSRPILNSYEESHILWFTSGTSAQLQLASEGRYQHATISLATCRFTDETRTGRSFATARESLLERNGCNQLTWFSPDWKKRDCAAIESKK